MASKRTIILSIIALFYFICCVIGANAVSQSVANYISENGWDQFDFYALLIGIIFLVGIAVLFGIRLWLKRPSQNEFIFGFIGLGFTIYVLHGFVLLTTEYIHIPQFIILTLLLCMAFPEKLSIAIMVSASGCIVDEWIQSWMPNRVLDFNDIFLNFIGLYFGLLIWWCMSIFLNKKESIEPPASC